MLWKELITPGFLGLMAEPDAQETAFLKQELTATFQAPGGAKANVKSGPGLLRKVNNRTRETTEEKVFMLDLDLLHGRQDRARPRRSRPSTSSTKTPGACSAPP